MIGNKESIVSLQYLRALAAGMVLFEHIGDKSDQVGGGILGFYKYGYTGVDVFFVISGFIMSLIYAQSHQGASNLVGFWKRRFVRIIPLYWALSFLALAIFIISPGNVNSSGGETVLLKSFFLIPGEGERFLIANGWTLSYEMLFYFVFSISFLAPTKAFGFISAIIIVVALGFSNRLGLFWPGTIIIEFSLGIFAYLLYRRFNNLSFSPFIIISGVMGLVFQDVLVNSFPESRHLTAGFPAFLLVYGVVSFETQLRSLPLKWLENLGDSSYSMYLFHPFVLKASGILFAYTNFSSYGIFMESLYWIITAFFVFYISYLVYKHIEIPLIGFARRFI